MTKETPYEDWVQIGEQTKLIDEELMSLVRLMMEDIDGKVPKSVYSPGLDKMLEGMTEFKSDMEGRMSEEVDNNVWDMKEFYGRLSNEKYRELTEANLEERRDS